MRVVLSAGPPALTRDVRAALAGRHEIHDAVDVRDGVRLAHATPGSVLVAVWPAHGLGPATRAALLDPATRPPIIAVIDPCLTADRQALVERRCDYVPLPFHPPELLFRLEHLEGRAVGRLRWLGDVCIDEEARTAHRAGQPVPLPHKEFDLLVHFVTYPRVVFSRDALLHSVWGSTEYTPNTVEVAVSSLRRRLEAHGPRIIHTVRGVGYTARPATDTVERQLGALMQRRAEIIGERDALIARRRELIQGAGRGRRGVEAADG